MKTQFYLLFSLKTNAGFEEYGNYYLGDNAGTAHALFGLLKGSDEIKNSNLLHIDLMETVDALPVKIRTICCTLDELGDNCRVIAKELFRLKNMEELR